MFLIHPGGPLFARKDEGFWSIPKGEYQPDEPPLEAARREFEEETGFRVEGAYLPLTPVRLKSGKLVTAWAVEGDVDAAALRSNLFRMEWPPGSGSTREFPEADRGAWFPLDQARAKIGPAQVALLDELERLV